MEDIIFKKTGPDSPSSFLIPSNHIDIFWSKIYFDSLLHLKNYHFLPRIMLSQASN